MGSSMVVVVVEGIFRGVWRCWAQQRIRYVVCAVKMHGDGPAEKIDSGANIPRLTRICKAGCGSPVPALQASSRVPGPISTSRNL